MKKLTALDTIIDNLIDTKEQMPTYRTLLRNCIGFVRPTNADEMLELDQVLLKLRLTDSDIEFENHEFKIMMDKVAENKIGLPQLSIGRLYAHMKFCEKESEKKPGLEIK